MKLPIGICLALSALLAACTGSGGGPAGDGADAGATEDRDEWDDRLDEREVDYSAALRIAALRLTGELPSLAEIQSLAQAGDAAAQAEVYRAPTRCSPARWSSCGAMSSRPAAAPSSTAQRCSPPSW